MLFHECQVNLDLPRDPATYLHRVGRTGRFGGKGLAVTLLSRNEVQGVQLLARVFKMQIDQMPSPVPPEIYTYAAADDQDSDTIEVEKTIDHGVAGDASAAESEAILASYEDEVKSVAPHTELEVVIDESGVKNVAPTTGPDTLLDEHDEEHNLSTKENEIVTKPLSKQTLCRYESEEKSYENWVKFL
ncbi:unnamed protein product [Phytophthora lilii]|uniref:RNA helicase n=1 Tax=Phytophthora lilii TaxID=2077276 RepID=A0A9W6TLT9_9STRA|nr:unnamed protein product [Phytophthora lilii]